MVARSIPALWTLPFFVAVFCRSQHGVNGQITHRLRKTGTAASGSAVKGESEDPQERITRELESKILAKKTTTLPHRDEDTAYMMQLMQDETSSLLPTTDSPTTSAPIFVPPPTDSPTRQPESTPRPTRLPSARPTQSPQTPSPTSTPTAVPVPSTPFPTFGAPESASPTGTCLVSSNIFTFVHICYGIRYSHPRSTFL